MKNVAVCGTFDMLHEGHRYFLKRAKEYGDTLYVAVVADITVLKNKNRSPAYSQDQRCLSLSKEDTVDYIIKLSGDDETDIEKIVQIPPHIYCFGHDQETVPWNQKLKERLKKEFGSGVKFYTIDAYDRERLSSTKILKRK